MTGLRLYKKVVAGLTKSCSWPYKKLVAGLTKTCTWPYKTFVDGLTKKKKIVAKFTNPVVDDL